MMARGSLLAIRHRLLPKDNRRHQRNHPIMAEIDEVIEEHGGWPGAFVTK